MQAPAAIGGVLEAVGGTPLIRLARVAGAGAPRLYAKAEHLEPGGSIKDRIAVSMIEAAERSGQLRPGGTVIEPTSGNTGVGLALACAARGYALVLTMPADMSLERRQLLEAYGARVVLTEPERLMEGAMEKASALAAELEGSFVPSQFENPANPAAHREGTAPELIEALEAEDGAAARLDAVVIGVGTGGTLAGLAPVLRRRFPGVRVVAVEPEASAVLSGRPPGLHRIQGIGAGFVPELLPVGELDEIVVVPDAEAWSMRGRLAREEGLLVGISSGANVWAALRVGQTLGPEAVVVTFLCDTGERYFSLEPFFDEGGP